MLGTWNVGDEMIGSGGTYGFGFDPFGGYAFGITNQAVRSESFYTPTLFVSAAPTVVENQFVPDAEAENSAAIRQTAVQPARTLLQESASSPQPASAQPPPSTLNWLGPVALIIAAIALLR